jgi:GH43 family beta-xylosidase
MKHIYLTAVFVMFGILLTGGVPRLASSQTLFSDDFSDGDSKGWDKYGGRWDARGVLTVKGGDGYKAVVTGGNYTDFVYEADVAIQESDGEAGLIFRVTNPGVGAGALRGYFLQINAGADTVVLGKITDEGWTQLGVRKLPIDLNVWYHLKVVAAGNNLKCYVNAPPVEPNPYPQFDAVDAAYASGAVGVRTWFSAAAFDNIVVSAYTAPVLTDTYTNPVKPYTGDPFVLYHQGVYYVYASQAANTSTGFKVFTSPDLVNWTDRGWALRKEDSWGERDFWAPEVIAKDGLFYMYYTVQERICVATSASPLGPFKQTVQEPMTPETIRIDPHVFRDDDGKYYFYYVAFNNGNEIWGAELNPDLLTINPNTMRRMIAPDQDWEKHRANVNEGPFVIKHNGTYYLTYSGSHVESPYYGVGYATAPHPLGPWTKYPYNPILKSTSYVHGPGHHCITASPDGTQLVIVYHTHENVLLTSPMRRTMAIDRLRFAPQANGPDVLEVWGPTLSPQPKIGDEQ